MLIADKVQNRVDFLQHHRHVSARADALDRYFRLWLERLGVDMLLRPAERRTSSCGQDRVDLNAVPPRPGNSVRCEPRACAPPAELRHGRTPISPKDFGASFKGFMEQMACERPGEEPFRRRLSEHFGADLEIRDRREKFSDANHPNLHPRSRRLSPRRDERSSSSVSAARRPFMGSLAQLVSGGGDDAWRRSGGPVAYANIALDGDRVLACTQLGVYLIREGDSASDLRRQDRARITMASA